MVPTQKGIAFFGGSRGSGYLLAEIQRNGSNFATAIGIKNNGVLIDSPSSLSGDITRYRSCEIIQSFAKVPTCKSVTRLLGSVERIVYSRSVCYIKN